MSLSTHSGQLERWLGKKGVEDLSVSMKDWYGPPIAVAGVPGQVFAHKGGDFRGRILAGKAATALDALENFGARLKRASHRSAYKEMSRVNTGFASLSDLISEATTGGKRQELAFNKVGPTKVVGSCSQLWQVGNWPAAGAVGAAAPGGTPLTGATTGGMLFNNPGSPDTTHYVSAGIVASATQTYLLYDRLFAVAKTINSTATEAVTGVPTRYQGTTAGANGSAEGNFLFVATGLTALANTAHNWTTCIYTNQAGTASQTLPSVAGNPGAVSTITHRLDLPNGTWFAPLIAGHTGIQKLTQMQCSALVATGIAEFVIGHPLAWQPVPLANVMCLFDGINTAFNMVQVFDNACLSHLEICAPATTATNVGGSITIVSG